MFSNMIWEYGASRGTKIRGRRSFNATSAARSIRLLLAPVAMADKLPVEHGHTTIGTGAPDPLATGAVHCVSEYTFI